MRCTMGYEVSNFTLGERLNLRVLSRNYLCLYFISTIFVRLALGLYITSVALFDSNDVKQDYLTTNK